MNICDSIHSALLWCTAAGLSLALASGSAAAQEPAPEPEAAAPAAPAASAASSTPASQTRAAASAVNAPGAAGARAKGATAEPKSTGKKPGATDRLALGTATVTGDREQPKVMYIVPWKSSDIGDLSGKPMNSLLDEALAPVDRDEFRRQVAYFDAVKADRPQNSPENPGAKQVEK